MASSISEVNHFADQGWTVVRFDVPSQGGPNQYLLKYAKPREPVFLAHSSALDATSARCLHAGRVRRSTSEAGR
jgi:hypothetical protein